MELIEQVLISPVENFWRALKVYYEHPKCINKQVLFSEHAFGGKLQSSLRGIEDLNNLYNRLCDCIVYNNEGSINIKNLEDIKFISGSAENVNNIFEALNGIYLLARKMIPKRIIPGSEFFEFFILGKIMKCFASFPILKH